MQSRDFCTESPGLHPGYRTRPYDARAENLIRLQNLREIPRLFGHALSISHCPDLGGFVLAPQFDGSIGFDIEIAARITVPIAARVLPHASESFLRDQLALAYASQIATSIWTAKEAAIK